MLDQIRSASTPNIPSSASACDGRGCSSHAEHDPTVPPSDGGLFWCLPHPEVHRSRRGAGRAGQLLDGRPALPRRGPRRMRPSEPCWPPKM